jgi:hypothetical protein
MRTGPAIGCLADTTRRLGIEVAMRHSNEEPADGGRAPEERPTVLGRRTIELPNTPAEESNQAGDRVGGSRDTEIRSQPVTLPG